MALKAELETQVKAILKTSWNRRAGTVVPHSGSVTLGNDAVEIEGAVLYADLADSTKLVDGYRDWFAAEVYKSFLHCAAKIIASEGGTITAYDGDRVMAVFMGEFKNTIAVRTAMKIHYARDMIRAAIKAEYPQTTFVLNHVCGVDSSKLFVAKTGIRGANDLVWVGRAANYAAKLASLPHDTPTWITDDVYKVMHASVKIHDSTDMWQARTWTQMAKKRIYCSTYWWRVD